MQLIKLGKSDEKGTDRISRDKFIPRTLWATTTPLGHGLESFGYIYSAIFLKKAYTVVRSKHKYGITENLLTIFIAKGFESVKEN